VKRADAIVSRTEEIERAALAATGL
jgi:hypothetical protein